MGNRRGSARTQQQKKQRFGARVTGFARDVRGELRRVSWPDRDQLRQSTAVVLIIVFVLGAYVAAWDFVFGSLARLIFA